MFTDTIKQSIQESVLCWLATVDADGMPNCSPKEIFAAYGEDEILIANIASPKSVSNLLHSAKVCVSFVHVFKQKGFKVKGHASYITQQDKDYPSLLEVLKPLSGDFPVQGVIRVKALEVFPIMAPSYHMVDGVTEEAQIESAKRTYGV